LSSQDCLIRLYMEAKQARRNGNLKEAAELLRRWLDIYQQKAKTELNQVYLKDENGDVAYVPTLVRGELGIVQVSSHDFAEALYTFMSAGSWPDCAFIAERILSLDDLTDFCRAHCKGDDEISKNMRHLLARRLMRAWKVKQAKEFFPADVLPHWEAYCKLSKTGNSTKLQPNDRAVAFYNLGRLLYCRGDKLFAAELDPDFFAAEECMFGFYSITGEKFASWAYENISWENRISLLPIPSARWHYRVRAVHSFMRAAMLTQNPDLKAACLILSGNILRYCNTEEADVYYKMLCDMRPYPMGSQAFEKRWLPDIPEKLQQELGSDTSRTLAEIIASMKNPK